MLRAGDLDLPAAQPTEPAGVAVASPPQPAAGRELGAALLHVRPGLHRRRPARGEGHAEGESLPGSFLTLYYVRLD